MPARSSLSSSSAWARVRRRRGAVAWVTRTSGCRTDASAPRPAPGPVVGSVGGPVRRAVARARPRRARRLGRRGAAASAGSVTVQAATVHGGDGAERRATVATPGRARGQRHAEDHAGVGARLATSRGQRRSGVSSRAGPAGRRRRAACSPASGAAGSAVSVGPVGWGSRRRRSSSLSRLNFRCWERERSSTAASSDSTASHAGRRTSLCPARRRSARAPRPATCPAGRPRSRCVVTASAEPPMAAKPCSSATWPS